jgi:BspA type Leucine rich repeat region (6 copies)
MNFYFIFLIASFIAGSIFLIFGFREYKYPVKSKNLFFTSALSFLAPVILTLILVSIAISSVLSPLLFGFIIFEVIAVIYISRFWIAEDHVARNTILGCSIFLFIQLLVLSFFLTALMGQSGYVRTREYGDFSYYEKAGQITISSYSGHDKIVEIPSSIYWRSVTSIEDYAFSNSDTGMTVVVIPDSITIIGSEAFANCSTLRDIVVPDSVITIGDYAFTDCYALTGITVSPYNPSFSSLAGILYNKNMETLIVCPAGKSGSITVPDTVTYICAGAFSHCSKLTSITIPESVTQISESALMNCENIVIYCREGSIAHGYAVDNSIEYEIVE